MMDEAQKDVSSATSKITHTYIQFFGRTVADYDDSLLTQRLVPFDSTTSSSIRQLLAFDFLGICNSF
jgi:hypothetical protein